MLYNCIIIQLSIYNKELYYIHCIIIELFSFVLCIFLVIVDWKPNIYNYSPCTIIFRFLNVYSPSILIIFKRVLCISVLLSSLHYIYIYINCNYLLTTPLWSNCSLSSYTTIKWVLILSWDIDILFYALVGMMCFFFDQVGWQQGVMSIALGLCYWNYYQGAMLLITQNLEWNIIW